MVIAALGTFLFGCSSKGGEQPQGSATAQKVTEVNNQEFVLKYLQSVQAGDKDKMY